MPYTQVMKIDDHKILFAKNTHKSSYNVECGCKSYEEL